MAFIAMAIFTLIFFDKLNITVLAPILCMMGLVALA